ncbi:MAG: NAD(P)/FAD-dependent oxidoreductase, partial [Nitrososphaera sp.]
HSITVVDRRDRFTIGAAKLWHVVGLRPLERSSRSLERLRDKGIGFVHGDIVAIDPEKRTVQTTEGELGADFVVVALGAAFDPRQVEMLNPPAYNLYDPVAITDIAKALESLTEGRIVIEVMGVPYKCPPAPYEASLLIHDMLERNGTRKEIEIDVYAPAPIALPVAGPEVSREVVAIIERHGIHFHASHKLKTVSDTLEFENGAVQNYDVLVGIPQHRVPDVIKSSGLAAGDWMAVDRKTLRTNFENVFAVGDVTEIKVGQLAIPKAGIFAEAQAKVVAQQIADEINNRSPSAAFDGKGFCFMETGNGQAGYVDADFFADPAPVVRLEPASQQNYEKKHDFERTRVRQWLL